MKIIKTAITLSLLLGTFSFNSNLLCAASAQNSVESVAVEAENKVNEYIYGADSDAYTAGKLKNTIFVMNDNIPKGWKVGVLGYKFKDSAKYSEWMGKFFAFVENVAIASVKNKNSIPAEKLKEIEDYCANLLDAAELKYFTPAQAVDGTMTNEGYGCNFANFYALISDDNKAIAAEWLSDPNIPMLVNAGIPKAENAILFRWKNPEYKEPDVATCAPSEGASASTVVDVATGVPSLKTTETFVFEGSDFKQSFQVVASDEEVASNPEGIKEISNRLVRLFNDMPKVASTIIGRMITSDGTLGVCPIICEIDGKLFKANLMFDANTTADQARKLADELDEKFSILKKQLLEKHKDKIDAEHQRVSEEHNLKLAEHEQRIASQEQKSAEAMQGNAVNISDINSAPGESNLGDVTSERKDVAFDNKVAEAERSKKIADEQLRDGLKSLQDEVQNTHDALKARIDGPAGQSDAGLSSSQSGDYSSQVFSQ